MYCSAARVPPLTHALTTPPEEAAARIATRSHDVLPQVRPTSKREISSPKNFLESFFHQLIIRRSEPYGFGMRSLRRPQVFQGIYPNALPDQLGRVAEVMTAIVLLVITLPLMAFLALAIKWAGPDPIFERHTRIGRDGCRFQVLKFCTTAPDLEHSMPVCTRKTTQIGEFLRYTRLECLPQLLNVLRGEMSLRETCAD